MKEIRKWGQKLPHWQQSNNPAYFITFRLGDSIPQRAASKLESERNFWIHKHPKPWDRATTLEYHKIFSSRIDKLMDAGHGGCILNKEQIRKLLIEILQAKDTTDYLLHNWVIMPNHVHILVSIPETVNLSSVIGTWKRISAIRINRFSNSKGSVWQKNYFDRIIRDWEHFQRVACYIRKNPSHAMLDEGDYSYWHADWMEKLLS